MAADKNACLDESKRQIDSIVTEYLKQSETSGNTPTEGHFREYGTRLVKSIVKKYKNKLTKNELNSLTSSLSNYFETEMVPRYRRSLLDHPRAANGYEPQLVDQNTVDKYNQTLKQEEVALIEDIKYLMKESERTNRTPSKTQALSWLRERMAKDLEGWDDEQGRRYVRAYIDEWLESEYDRRLTQSMSSHPRIENEHWPWKTDAQEKGKDDSNDGIPSTRSSGPKKEFHSRSPFSSEYRKTYQSFSGYDMVCTIEMPLLKGGTYTQVIGELQTVTYSIHQEKTPVRCNGDMNAKGYVFGPRTIAGTLIFTVFDRHWTTKMMEQYLSNAGINAHMLADEFPPFNITISCANEYGHDAVCSIFGITLVNEGQVMSINDVFTENTYQFYATDVQYLAPVEVTMGGTKTPSSNLPTVNTQVTPSPEKPAANQKPQQPSNKNDNTTNPDPDKPPGAMTVVFRKNKQADTPVDYGKLGRALTDGEYKNKLQDLNAKYENQKAELEKNSPSGSNEYKNMMKQRLAQQYTTEKEDIARMQALNGTKPIDALLDEWMPPQDVLLEREYKEKLNKLKTEYEKQKQEAIRLGTLEKLEKEYRKKLDELNTEYEKQKLEKRKGDDV